MKHVTPEMKIKMDAELEPIRVEISRLRSSVLNAPNSRIEEACRDSIKECKKRMERIRRKYGIYLDYSYINDDRDHGFSYKWSIICEIYDLVPLPSRMSNDGCHSVHEWLVQIGAVRKNVNHDHESSCAYYYFSTRQSAQNFVDKLNKKIYELEQKGYL